MHPHLGCASRGRVNCELALCDGCGCAAYCAAACQRKDWLLAHKPLCRALQADPPRHAAALRALAHAYFEAPPTGFNAAMAVQLFKRGAQLGCITSAYCVGVMLLDKCSQFVAPLIEATTGLPYETKDTTQTWLSESNQQGIAIAAAANSEIAALQGLGGGSPLEAARADAAEAVRWLTVAAEAGHGQGMYNLSSVYDNGLLVPRDMGKSFTWLLAALQYPDTSVRLAAAVSLVRLCFMWAVSFVCTPIATPWLHQ